MKPPNLPGEESIKKDEDERPKVATLPDDLIFSNILPRLRVKPLIRFKSVCKNWRSSISTPEFSKSQLSFSRSRHQFLLLQRDALVESSNFCLVSYDLQIGGEYTPIRIAGCCDGLLCMYSQPPYLGAMKFWVSNPATGQQREILGPGDDNSLKDCYFWFGYVSSIEDYKIVGFNPFAGVIWTFSQKAGIWKRISCHIEKYGAFMKVRSYVPVLVDDCVYWPLNVYRFHTNVGTHIVEFNLISEEYEVKPRMKFADADEAALLVNLKGCLAVYATNHHKSCVSIWKLRHKDDWNSWEKVVLKNIRGVTLIYYSPTGKLAVCHEGEIKVVEDLSELSPQGEGSSELGKYLRR